MRKLICLLLFLGSWTAQAQIPQPDPDTTAKHFLIVASIKNLQEVNSGRLAIAQAKNGEVKAFGEMMVKDHEQAEQQLLTMAKRKGIMLPPAATGGIQADLLLKNAGARFDKMYIHAMVAGHGDAVKEFENYAVTGKDADVRNFARQQLPVLKTHLAEAKGIDEKLK